MLSSHHNTKCLIRSAVLKKLDDDIDVNGGEDVDGDDIKTCFLQSKQWVDGSASLAIGGTFAGRGVKVCHDDDDDDDDQNGDVIIPQIPGTWVQAFVCSVTDYSLNRTDN